MTEVPSAMTVFDRALVRRRRDRAAAGFSGYDFLFAETAAGIAERLGLVRRSFARTLDLGCHDGAAGRLAAAAKEIGQRVCCDLSPALAARAGGLALAADEEALPFADASFDLVLSNLSLHWVNDLPGALLQIRRVLRADGFFLATLLGGDTLVELRRSLFEAELEVTGGAAPRLSPFATLADAGQLLRRAGFALPVADIETVTVTYRDLFGLMADLRGMAETSALLARSRRPLRRAVLMETARRYAERYAEPDGRLPATFQILHLAGWAPDPGQQQPARPGSATVPLAAILG
ncbi:MAG: methyltransferase domain-containing protein [Rhodospirillaceae bacterium]